MHSTDIGTVSGPPQFLKKLWKLVEDPAYDELIYWGPDGRTFVIKNQLQFAKDVLPLYFKHSNIASFIRQLNMYGFSKVPNIEHGGLKTERDDIEFHHDEGYFKKGEENLLSHIKRKISVVKGEVKALPAKTGLNQMLLEVTSLRNKHDSMQNTLTNLQRENEVVWRELSNLRQKYAQQQQMLSKMIQFLVSMVHNSNRVGAKRKHQLMLTEPSLKREKLVSRHLTLEPKITTNIEPENCDLGPVIHDVTDEDTKQFLLVDPTTGEPVDEIQSVLQGLVTPKSENDVGAVSGAKPENNTSEVLAQVLKSCDLPSTSYSTYSAADSTGEPNTDSTVAIKTKKEITDNINAIQAGIDLISPELDWSLLMDFMTEEGEFGGVSVFDEMDDKKEINGTELVQVNSTNFSELTEEGADFFQENPDPESNELPEFDNNILNTPDPLFSNFSFPVTKKST